MKELTTAASSRKEGRFCYRQSQPFHVRKIDMKLPPDLKKGVINCLLTTTHSITIVYCFAHNYLSTSLSPSLSLLLSCVCFFTPQAKAICLLPERCDARVVWQSAASNRQNPSHFHETQSSSHLRPPPRADSFPYCEFDPRSIQG